MATTHQSTATMTGKAALWALYKENKKETKAQPASDYHNFRKEFVDWCEIQNEELLMNTGSIA